jgi:competence protein ComGC
MINFAHGDNAMHRRAFTLVQMIVILALLLLLLGFLVSMLAQVRRGAAAQSVGFNNLRQLGLAVHSYHDTYNRWPPTVGTVNNQSGPAHFHILPFIEQDNLYRLAEGKVWHKGVNTTPIPTYVDPDDASAPPKNKFNDWLATTNYAANWMVFKTGDMRIANITDGLENTSMFAQRYQVCNGTPTAWGYPSLYTWAPMFGYYSQGKFQSRPSQADCDPTLPQSIQAGGIQVVFCDGSARLMADSISPQTWWFVTHPADGNVLGQDFND